MIFAKVGPTTYANESNTQTQLLTTPWLQEKSQIFPIVVEVQANHDSLHVQRIALKTRVLGAGLMIVSDGAGLTD